MPWRRAWQHTPVFLLGEPHGQRSLADYSRWSHRESDMTEAAEAHVQALCIRGAVSLRVSCAISENSQPAQGLGLLCRAVWITANWGKVFKTWEYQTTWSASWEICMQVRKRQLELDMDQQTGSKLGKEYVKAVYCHPTYLTYMQSTSCKMLGWTKHNLESRLSGEMSITSDMQLTQSLRQKAKRN